MKVVIDLNPKFVRAHSKLTQRNPKGMHLVFEHVRRVDNGHASTPKSALGKRPSSGQDPLKLQSYSGCVVFKCAHK